MQSNNELVYKEILNITPSIILGLDKNGDIFLLNKRGCEVLGYEREEIIGKNWFSTCLPPETVPEIKKVFKRLMAGEVGPAEKVENKVVTKSGQLIDIFWHNIILNDDKQAIIGTLSSGEDIADYKKKEAELRLMKRALENAPVMAYRIKLEKNKMIFEYVSKNSQHIGYTPEEMIGVDPLVFVHPDDRARVAAEVERFAESDAANAEHEYRMIAKDKKVHWIDSLVEIIRDDKGVARYLQGTFVDITEHKEVEDKMKEASIVLENSPAVMYRVRLTGEANRPLEFISGNIKQFGYAPEEFMGGQKGLKDVIYPPDLSKLIKDSEEFAKRGNPDEYLRAEYRVIAKDGTKRWVEDFGKLIFDDSNRPTHFRGLIIDITERKAMEEKSQEVSLVLENTPAILYRVNLAKEGFPIEFVSDNVRQFGYESQDFVTGKLTTANITHPDDLDRSLTEMQDFAKTNPAPGTHLRQEYRVITKDKRVRHIEDFSEIIRDADGAPAYYQGLILDITERKEAEEKIKWANMVVENSSAILFRWRATEGWPVEFVSNNIKRFGYAPEEFTTGAIPYMSVIDPEDLEKFGREVETYSKSGASNFHQEYRLITKDKKNIWVDDLTEIIRDATGRITHYQGVILDITERKAMEEKLRLRTVELERVNQFMVNRELKMVELKERIKQLEEKKNN